ncbi:GrpB family protein [Pseudoxanthomonas sp. LjRoot125]|uniref:GrpB family protein n=1 Tax=Pseudoxanthomonas sp. LjRoot125 TaxID=3342258 RepID=UPI003E11C0EF
MSATGVELLPHDPAWAERAQAEETRLREVLGDILVVVHHIGSTSIPGMPAKPVIDLIPVVRGLSALEAHRAGVEALGYEWCGEFGLPGRRYCRKDDPLTGGRLVQLHAYAEGDREILRHLAFRDFLRRDAALAAEYATEKMRCQRLHPDDSRAYSACKADWIRDVEARALRARTSTLPTME